MDCELVALEQNGVPSFQALQNSRSTDRSLCLYAFDVLHLNGYNLRLLPFDTRKQILAEVIRGSAVRFSEAFDADPEVLLTQIKELRLEGIVAKKRTSAYDAGTRNSWLKFKIYEQEDFVIGGFLAGNPLESILVGAWDGEVLNFVGEVRGGFNRFNRKKIAKVLSVVPVCRCPFANLPDRRLDRWGEGITEDEMDSYTWIEPLVSVRIGFREWTGGKRLREPRFVALIGQPMP